MICRDCIRIILHSSLLSTSMEGEREGGREREREREREIKDDGLQRVSDRLCFLEEKS